MATKNRIAYALPIIQIMQIPLAKLPIQICLRLVCGERVGIILRSLKTQCLCEFASKTQYIKTKKALLTFTVDNAFFITLILFL